MYDLNYHCGRFFRGGGGKVRKSIRDNIPKDAHIYSTSDQLTPEMKGFGGELAQNLGWKFHLLIVFLQFNRLVRMKWSMSWTVSRDDVSKLLLLLDEL